MLKFLAVALTLCAVCFSAHAELPSIEIPDFVEFVSFSSLDGNLELTGTFMRASKKHSPTVILLHGSSGMWIYRRGGVMMFREMVKNYNRRGNNVLMVDSLRPRDIESLNRSGKRELYPDERAKDVWAAIEWLKKQDSVDPKRIVLVGFSNGAATVLSAVDASVAHPEIAAGVAFYPRCAGFLGERDRIVRPIENYAPSAPLSIMIGEDDEETPPAPCRRLSRKLQDGGFSVDYIEYPNVGHGFNIKGNRANADQKAATKDSDEKLMQFLAPWIL